MLLIQDITVSYHNVEPAVRNVSLEVPDKGVVALLGANGAGKTTILRAISGLLKLHGASLVHGAILFDNERIDRLDATQIVQRGIIQVLEGRRLFGELTVDENLRVGAITARDPAATRKAYERVMDLFPRLRERREIRAGKLSGGEQQMLAIARALMTNPELLLMDEPTEGLAPLLVREVGRVIENLKSQGLSILLVEQNLPLALRVCDQVHVLSRGRIVHSCSSQALWENEEIKSRYLGF